MRLWTVLWLPVVAASVGCGATHYGLNLAPDLLRSGIVNDPKTVSQLEKSMTDSDIARLLDVDVRAKLPTAVAVARVTSDCGGYQPRLATIDAAELRAWEKALEGQKHLHGIRPVTPLSAGEADRPTLHALRVAAARMNCELLLVYLQRDSAVDNFNEACVLYWTLIGLWLVPGDTLEHRTVMQGVLLDCRTGMVLGTLTGDSHLKRSTPAAFADIEKNRMKDQAPAEALAELQKGFDRLIGQVVQSALVKDRHASSE